jgi:glycosyltransferase involved in cell wall biosynthesis
MADCISTVSYGLRDELQQAHSISADVFYNIATHYLNVGAPPAMDWTALNPRLASGKIKLIYTGSTPENYYDLAALVGAVRYLKERTPELAGKMQLIFVGACAEAQREMKRQNLIGEEIVFIPHVPHEMAKAIQQNADILLYLTYLGKGAVSTKIFEYFALGKPILPVSVPKDSDVDRLLTTYCGSSCNLHSSEDILAALQRVARNGGLASLPRMKEPGTIYRLLDDYKRYARMLLSK